MEADRSVCLFPSFFSESVVGSEVFVEGHPDPEHAILFRGRPLTDTGKESNFVRARIRMS
jgi:hypothetical protein